MSSTSYRIISLARNGCQFLFRFHLVQCLPFEENNLLWPVQSLEQGDHESRIVQPFEIGSPFPISYLSSFASSCVQVIKLPVGYVSWAFELLVRRCWLRASWQPSWLWKRILISVSKLWTPTILQRSFISHDFTGNPKFWGPLMFQTYPLGGNMVECSQNYILWFRFVNHHMRGGFKHFECSSGEVCFLQERISQKHETLLGDPPYLVRAERFTVLQKQNPLLYIYISICMSIVKFHVFFALYNILMYNMYLHIFSHLFPIHQELVKTAILHILQSTWPRSA